MNVCHPPGLRLAFLAGFLFGLASGAGAQDKAVGFNTQVDKRSIRLGDPAVITVTVTLSPNTSHDARAIWPDTLRHFEWLAPPRTDTSVVDGRMRVAFSRPFTSFDSGRWTLPSIALAVDGRSLISDTVGMHVGTVSLTGEEYRDIGDIFEGEAEPARMTPLVYAALAGLILACLMAWFHLRRRRNATGPSRPVTSPGDAYGEAMQGLDRLDEKGLVDSEATRAYHGNLYGLLRGYLRKAHGWDVSSLTTGDLMALLSRHCPDRERLSRLAGALRLSDAVRFARHLPPTADSVRCAGEVRSFIRFLHENGPHQ